MGGQEEEEEEELVNRPGQEKRGRDWETLFATSLAILLITYTPLSSIYFIFIPAGYTSLLILAPYLVCIVSIWLNYYLTWSTSPGHVPKAYNPDKNTVAASSTTSASLLTTRLSNQNSTSSSAFRRSSPPSSNNSSSKIIVSQVKKSTLGPRWCRRCLCWKPPRSHHCSACDKCILKMDHHCPWVATCVGHGNQPFFYRFLVSITVSTIFSLSLIALRIWNLIQRQNSLDASASYETFQKYIQIPPLAGPEIIFLVFNSIILFLLLIMVGILTAWQTYYISKNVTTIESFENEKIDDLADRGRIHPDDAIFPYDTGNWFRNFSSVLGARWWLWLSPLVSAPGTGTEFEISSKVIEIAKQRQRESSAAQNSSSVIDDTIVVVWPPVEYSRYKSDPNYINTVKKNGVTVGGSGGGGGNAGVLGNRRSGKEIQLDRYLDRNDQQDSSSGSDEEEPNDRASTGGRGGDSSGGRRRKNRHVRRGSEGYIVKEYTDEDRQRMLRAAQLHDKAEAGLDSFSSGSSSSSDVGVVDSSSSDEDATPLNSVKDRLLRNKNRNEVGKTVER